MPAYSHFAALFSCTSCTFAGGLWNREETRNMKEEKEKGTLKKVKR